MRPELPGSKKDQFRSPTANKASEGKINFKTQVKKKATEPLRASSQEMMPSCLENYFSKNEFQEAVESS